MNPTEQSMSLNWDKEPLSSFEWQAERCHVEGLEVVFRLKSRFWGRAVCDLEICSDRRSELGIDE